MSYNRVYYTLKNIFCNKIKYSKRATTIKRRYVFNNIGRRHYSNAIDGIMSNNHNNHNNHNNGDNNNNNKTEMLCIWIPVIYYMYYKCGGGGGGNGISLIAFNEN